MDKCPHCQYDLLSTTRNGLQRFVCGNCGAIQSVDDIAAEIENYLVELIIIPEFVDLLAEVETELRREVAAAQ